MVRAQLGVSAEDAFARLRAYAVTEQRLLKDVAVDVVSRRLRFTSSTHSPAAQLGVAPPRVNIVLAAEKPPQAAPR
ncbi:MAG: hypothetical protein ACRDS0_18830 [Pseudonocardiaceae bacterium]